MADPAKLADSDRRFVARLLADAPKLAEAVAVVKRLHRVLWNEGDEPLQDVLTAAADTNIPVLDARLGLKNNTV